MNKFEKFQSNYDAAIESIKKFLEPGPYEPQMNGLVKWMMETDVNPYSYLPEGWAGSTGSAEAFDSLLGYIHHAVYDDGDICFVTVDGAPRIVFAHQHDDNFRDRVLTAQEKSMELNPIYGNKCEIVVLKIQPNEFGPMVEAVERDRIKQCFIWDSARNDVEWVATNYRKYKCWDESWIDECKEKVTKHKQKLVEAGIL